MTRRLRLATGAWMTIILVASLLPEQAGGRGGAVWHLIGYGVLVVLLAAFQPPAIAAAVSWIYGAVVELLQWLVPYRAAEGGDLFMNAAGVVLGLLVSRGAPSSWRRQKGSPR
ncbi:MAG: VanZ family protein [Armatimonadetes bacterium]|nr:VanZ family protein [Armatimonadota bacterium]